MFVIDRRDAKRFHGVADPTMWHAVWIWLPRFVLTATDGAEPRWTFLGIGRAIRKSIGSIEIGDRIVHRWVYQTDTTFA